MRRRSTALMLVGCLFSPWAAAQSGPRAEGACVPVPAKELSQRVGQTICLHARPAVELHQHLVGVVEGKKAQYVDLDGGGQLVAHAAEKLICAGTLELTAKVVELRGSSKRPGKKSEVVEHALDVQAWRCLSAP